MKRILWLIIAFQKKALNLDKEVAPEMLYDFSLVHSLNREFAKAGWEGMPR